MTRNDTEQRRKEECCELLIWNFPKHLKQKLKEKCAAEDVTMQATVIALIEGFVRA